MRVKWLWIGKYNARPVKQGTKRCYISLAMLTISETLVMYKVSKLFVSLLA